MKAATCKKLAVVSAVVIVIVFCFGGFIHPDLNSKTIKASLTNQGTGFSGFFSPKDKEQEIHSYSLHKFLEDKKWNGRSLHSYRRSSTSRFGSDDDLVDFRKALVSGAINITHQSTYPMDTYMDNWEWAILGRPALSTAMDAGNGTTSTLTMLNEHSTYRVGDVITVRVDVRDGKGNLTKHGGDQVRVWIVDNANQASQASHVIDVGNGSFISDIPLSWAGAITIKASLTYNTAIQRAHFFVRNVAKTTRFLAASFETVFSSEATLCCSMPIIPGSINVCNFTKENGGIPWYCGKPHNPGLDCGDWKSVTDVEFYSPLPMTQVDKIWSNSIRMSKDQVLPKNIVVNVVSETPTSPQRPKPRCGSLPLEKSWTSKAPRGFFKSKVWTPSKCTLPVMSEAATKECLRNTTFIMLGDSNLRLAFQILSNRIRCKINTGTVKPKWHKPLTCLSNSSANDKDTTTKVFWFPHGFPFHLGSYEPFADRHDYKHPHEYIDEIPNNRRFVVLIHLYLHLTPHHHSLFRSMVKAIRTSVDNLLRRNPEVKVIFRGPHAAGHFKDWYGISGGDLSGPVYTDIIKRELKGLYDKVFFLQPWDMTIATENNDFHPPDYINQSLMNLILEYVCWNK